MQRQSNTKQSKISKEIPTKEAMTGTWRHKKLKKQKVMTGTHRKT